MEKIFLFLIQPTNSIDEDAVYVSLRFLKVLHLQFIFISYLLLDLILNYMKFKKKTFY